MSYVISGTSVSSVDYEDRPFGGNAGTGNALSSAPTGWISYTMARPSVRVAPDGKSYFVIKNVSFRVCAAPDAGGKSGSSKKMYGRASYSDGSSYVNSHQPPNPISWQKAPTHTYTFQLQSPWFAVKDGVGSSTIRLWLVSGGPFLFERNSTATGHVVGSAGQTWSGAPVGYITIAQIASAPTNLKVVRSSSNPQQITATWGKEARAGGTTSGYHLEVAEDANFTVNVKEYYPPIKSGGALTYTASGYSQNKAYWFRIACRNEVSEKFKLKGGQWSNVASIPVAPAGATGNPPPDAGIPGGVGGGQGAGDPGGASGGADGGTGSAGDGTGGTVGGQPNDPGSTDPASGTTGSSGSAGAPGSSASGSVPTPPPIVFTPIPDTSATRTAFGQRLVSRQPKSTKSTVFVYDRGGHRRIGQLTGWSQLAWSRVKDDRSAATVTLTPEEAIKNKAVLDRMAACRSELVIYRGDQRVWEGPITLVKYGRNALTISADDVLWYAARTVMHGGYSNAYPNVGNVVERIAGIMSAEMARLETPVLAKDGTTVLVPAINVLPHLHTYVEDGDAQTSVVTDPYSGYVWNHLDDLAARSGIDYTVVGRAIHIWDTSRAALGSTRTVTDEDFIGAPDITQYGSELATSFTVTDGQGDFATAYDPNERANPFYGEIELLATAYGVTSTTTTTDPTTGAVVKTTTEDTLTTADMIDQATHGAQGRSPVPWMLNIPANSSIDVSRPGLGLDVLIPGVFVPVVATFSGKSFSQLQKVARVDVTVTATKSGISESVSATLDPVGNYDPTTDSGA